MPADRSTTTDPFLSQLPGLLMAMQEGEDHLSLSELVDVAEALQRAGLCSQVCGWLQDEVDAGSLTALPAYLRFGSTNRLDVLRCRYTLKLARLADDCGSPATAVAIFRCLLHVMGTHWSSEPAWCAELLCSGADIATRHGDDGTATKAIALAHRYASRVGNRKAWSEALSKIAEAYHARDMVPQVAHIAEELLAKLPRVNGSGPRSCVAQHTAAVLCLLDQCDDAVALRRHISDTCDDARLMASVGRAHLVRRRYLESLTCVRELHGQLPGYSQADVLLSELASDAGFRRAYRDDPTPFDAVLAQIRSGTALWPYVECVMVI